MERQSGAPDPGPGRSAPQRETPNTHSHTGGRDPMSLRLSVTALREADAIVARDARSDTTVIVLSCRLTLGQLLVTAGHLARRLKDVPPDEDVGIRLGLGEVTAMSPVIADRALVDLMDRPDLDVEDVEALLDLLRLRYDFPGVSGGGLGSGQPPGSDSA